MLVTKWFIIHKVENSEADMGLPADLHEDEPPIVSQWG